MDSKGKGWGGIIKVSDALENNKIDYISFHCRASENLLWKGEVNFQQLLSKLYLKVVGHLQLSSENLPPS